MTVTSLAFFRVFLARHCRVFALARLCYWGAGSRKGSIAAAPPRQWNLLPWTSRRRISLVFATRAHPSHHSWGYLRLGGGWAGASDCLRRKGCWTCAPAVLPPWSSRPSRVWTASTRASWPSSASALPWASATSWPIVVRRGRAGSAPASGQLLFVARLGPFDCRGTGPRRREASAGPGGACTCAESHSTRRVNGRYGHRESSEALSVRRLYHDRIWCPHHYLNKSMIGCSWANHRSNRTHSAPLIT